jgi:hypothetical protein
MGQQPSLQRRVPQRLLGGSAGREIFDLALDFGNRDGLNTLLFLLLIEF